MARGSPSGSSQTSGSSRSPWGIAATGPGRFSLDRLIGWDGSLSGVWWGVGALGGAALISLLTLTLGRRRPPPAQATELRRAA